MLCLNVGKALAQVLKNVKWTASQHHIREFLGMLALTAKSRQMFLLFLAVAGASKMLLLLTNVLGSSLDNRGRLEY